ncbi:MAG: fimbrial protein [Alphaproteobacteria bacterium]
MTDPAADSHRSADPEKEPPLDPAVERVRRKLARLMVGSIGVMVLGLIAVFAAIVYKVGASDQVADESSQAGSDAAGIPLTPAAGAPEGRFTLPAGARIVETDLDGNRVLIRLVLPDGEQKYFLFDFASGKLLARRGLDRQ